jgi:hypothetical protein
MEGGRIRRGDGSNPDARLQLQWFHLTLLERLLFPGIIRKKNRLISARASPRMLRDRLMPLTRAGPPAWEPVAEAAASGSGWALERALVAVLSDDARRERLIGALNAERPPGRNEPADTSLEAAQAALHARLPDVFASPYADDYGKGDNPYRHCQHLEWEVIGEDIRRHLGRLLETRIEPYYGVRGRFASIGVLRYVAGGYFLVHTDSENPAVVNGRAVWRRVRPYDLSILLYLSSPGDFSGGRLWFPDQNILVTPDEGMAVVFPSDRRFPHCAQEVTSGTRYAIVAWVECPDPEDRRRLRGALAAELENGAAEGAS